MAVPEEIRKVERPKGTVVCDGKNGIYPVREKLSGGYYVDSEGKRHRPSKNGKVVGHIINMKFVPKKMSDDSVAKGNVDLKDWGNIELIDRLNQDIHTILGMFYTDDDANMIYIMSILRASYRGMHDRMLQRQYEETFLTEMYPVMNLHRSHVSTFLRNVGRCCSRINDFMRTMVSAIKPEDHIIIDGSLRQDHSRVNSLSEVSRKTCKLGYKEITLMYAYSLTKREPVCSKVYPGNMVDQRAVGDFIEDFQIKEGIIVADKGFPPESVKVASESKNGLHYLLPLKRDRREITDLDLYTFDSRLESSDGIQCKRVCKTIEDKDVWFYSFRDPKIAMEEEIHYMLNHKAGSFDPADLNERRMEFGTLCFESDLELDHGRVYEIYGSRWLIELFFRSQEDTMEMDDTREQSDYSVIASNFIDYIASIMSSRLLVFLDDRGLLNSNTYGDIMRLLLRIKMTRVSDSDDWKVRKIAEVDADILEKIGLLHRPIVPKEVKKRGRPKGSKDSYKRVRNTKKNNVKSPAV